MVETPEAIRVARRYIRFLRRLLGEARGEGIRRRFCIWMECGALRVRRHLEAADLLQKAVNDGSGDQFLQSEGPLMSFEVDKPIAPAFEVVTTRQELWNPVEA